MTSQTILYTTRGPHNRYFLSDGFRSLGTCRRPCGGTNRETFRARTCLCRTSRNGDDRIRTCNLLLLGQTPLADWATSPYFNAEGGIRTLNIGGLSSAPLPVGLPRQFLYEPYGIRTRVDRSTICRANHCTNGPEYQSVGLGPQAFIALRASSKTRST